MSRPPRAQICSYPDSASFADNKEQTTRRDDARTAYVRPHPWHGQRPSLRNTRASGRDDYKTEKLTLSVHVSLFPSPLTLCTTALGSTFGGSALNCIGEPPKIARPACEHLRWRDSLWGVNQGCFRHTGRARLREGGDSKIAGRSQGKGGRLVCKSRSSVSGSGYVFILFFFYLFFLFFLSLSAPPTPREGEGRGGRGARRGAAWPAASAAGAGAAPTPLSPHPRGGPPVAAAAGAAKRV